MGLATIDPHSRKKNTEIYQETMTFSLGFTKSPSLVYTDPIVSKIQPFKNVKIYKEMYGVPDSCPVGHTFLCKFWDFQMAVSCLLLGLFATYLGILWISVYSFRLCGSIVANPIIYRLVPNPSRYEIRQLQSEGLPRGAFLYLEEGTGNVSRVGTQPNTT